MANIPRLTRWIIDNNQQAVDNTTIQTTLNAQTGTLERDVEEAGALFEGLPQNRWTTLWEHLIAGTGTAEERRDAQKILDLLNIADGLRVGPGSHVRAVLQGIFNAGTPKMVMDAWLTKVVTLAVEEGIVGEGQLVKLGQIAEAKRRIP